MTGRAKRWVFTLNNYTEAEVADVHTFGQSCEYLVYGRETGLNGTPHLQGYFSLTQRKTFNQVKAWFPNRAHLEVARGTPQQNRTYCTKDGQFEEFGTFPQPQGARSDLDRIKEWIDSFVVEFRRVPTDRELATEAGTTFIRYRRGLLQYAAATVPFPNLRQGELRPWQATLDQELDEFCEDDRKIKFVVDRVGNKGKTWFSQWFLTKHPTRTQILGMGKRDDMAHSIDASKDVFFINVPRDQMQYLQYSVLESLKDKMIFSPKYESQMKVLARTPHVVVMCNEWPDEEKLSHDRYDFIDLDN